MNISQFSAQHKPKDSKEIIIELNKSEIKFQSICEITSDWIWEVDEHGIYTYSNPKVKDILGYLPEEIIGKSPFELMPKGEAEKIAVIFKKITKSKKAFFNLVNVNLHKTGRKVVLETSGVPLFDGEGSLKGFRGIDRDISRRKQLEDDLIKAHDQLAQKVEERTRELNMVNEDLKAQIKKCRQIEKELRSSEQRFRMLVETMNEGLAIQDAEGNVAYVNGKVLEITGYKKEELIGQPAATFFKGRNKSIYLKESSKRGQKIEEPYEIEMTAKDGTQVATLISPKVIVDTNGEFQGSFAVITDIRSLKKTEAALKKRKNQLKQKSESLRGMNTALRVLLKEREKDKSKVAKRLLSNIRQLIWPYIDKLADTRLTKRQKYLLDILTSNLEELQSNYGAKLSSEFANLTQAELNVANLVKLGKSTQEIADVLSISYKTTETHRFRIRKKLGLNNKKTNLRTYISSME